MKPEAINIAIAEICGFVPNGAGYWHKNGHVYSVTGESEDTECCGGIGGAYVPPLPNYYGCLNAMHVAEMSLRDMDFDVYRLELQKFGRDIRATSEQRAEAFLRTFNKWIN